MEKNLRNLEANMLKKLEQVVFTKVESVNSKVVKKHIIGTPARTKPSRKFETVIQPPSLLEESTMPSSGLEHKGAPYPGMAGHRLGHSLPGAAPPPARPA